eukprot:CAMPEP_0184708776 /NCGR_PEP_ID=MMETSP0313-20130426/37951_1 /TAXON_ID=2792 /ORGANISM="Porphyridium aerugineum, Strain SAG 1380-2" /LENGTH=438 /DNA_ID=CAMNT_0027170379 /DNA_START=32 /DNA_END=1348 /DNA_ORIENTATION=-
MAIAHQGLASIPGRINAHINTNLSAIPALWKSATRYSSSWSKIPQGPEDPILGVTLAYRDDPNPKKINLGVGAYRNNEGKPLVLKVVRHAEKVIFQKELDMEYLPVIGDKSFIKNAVKLAYQGPNGLADIDMKHFAGIQTLSGTGACRMALELFSRFMDKPPVYVPNPTWANHTNIIKDSRCEAKTYRYYDAKTCLLDFKGMMEDISEMPNHSIILLHACAHNPTGVDPSPHQWDELSALMKKKNHIPFFDMAYQGFTSGDCDKDAYAVRKFKKDGHHIALAQSFSKNFGLYSHRVGCLSLTTGSQEETNAVESQLKILARPMYSNPPIFGVRVVNEILSDPKQEKLWRVELKDMAERIIDMRKGLQSALEKLGSTKNWGHITKQHGMFCYSGLTPEQVDKLRYEHSVYLTRNGRISMAGVTPLNMDYLAHAIHAVTK